MKKKVNFECSFVKYYLQKKFVNQPEEELDKYYGVFSPSVSMGTNMVYFHCGRSCSYKLWSLHPKMSKTCIVLADRRVKEHEIVDFIGIS